MEVGEDVAQFFLCEEEVHGGHGGDGGCLGGDVGAGDFAGGLVGEADGEGVRGLLHEGAGEGVAILEGDAEEAVAGGDGFAGEDERLQEESRILGSDFSEIGTDRTSSGVGGMAADALGGDVIIEEVFTVDGITAVKGAGVSDKIVFGGGGVVFGEGFDHCWHFRCAGCFEGVEAEFSGNFHGTDGWQGGDENFSGIGVVEVTKTLEDGPGLEDVFVGEKGRGDGDELFGIGGCESTKRFGSDDFVC